MSDIYINPTTGDIDLVGGSMRLTEGVGELARQRTSIYLNMYRGEWFANILTGIPWVKNNNNLIQLLGGGNKDLIDLYIKEGILSRNGVESINKYTSIWNKPTRTLTIVFEAVASDGSVFTIDRLPVTL